MLEVFTRVFSFKNSMILFSYVLQLITFKATPPHLSVVFLIFASITMFLLFSLYCLYSVILYITLQMYSLLTGFFICKNDLKFQLQFFILYNENSSLQT